MTAEASPLDLIFVNDFATVTGGSDRVALSEAIGLAERGHRVTLIAGHGEPDPELAAAGIEVRTTGQDSTIGDSNRARAAAQGIWNLRAARLIREATAAADPSRTVIHTHGFVKVLSPSVMRACISSQLPVVATLHDYFAVCPNGGFFNYQTKQICQLTPLSRECIMTNCDVRMYPHKLWRVVRSGVQRRAGKVPAGVGHFIVPSRFAGEVVRPYLPREADLHVVPNPVAGAWLPPADPAAGKAFLFIGRLNPDKGPVLFAEAARQAGVPTVFVGDGVERERARAVHPGAEFTGWLEPEQLAAMLRRARAVVNASLWYETQGLSVLEAAAHGIPAVVAGESALRDAVEDGKTGLHFRIGDARDLAEKLSRLSHDAGLARRLGAAAYERFWSSSLDEKTHLDRLEAVYRAALADGCRE